MSYTMRLIKCPSCGGPLDPPAGVSSMTCTYCGNGIEIPESLRMPAKVQSTGALFTGIDTNALLGYGAQWADMVQAAQSGDKGEAIKKYTALTGQDASQAKYIVDALSGSQWFEFEPGNNVSVQQIYPAIGQAVTATTNFSRRIMWWVGCSIVFVVVLTLVLTALPILIGVFGGLLAALNAF